MHFANNDDTISGLLANQQQITRFKRGEFYGNVVVWQQKDVPVLNGSHCGNSFGKASLKLRLSFGYASIVPGWEKWAKKRGNYLVVTYTNPPTIWLDPKFSSNLQFI
jgi:hypothetical protein